MPLDWQSRFPALSILSATKSFHDPWVGHPTLNRLGLHPARIALADAMTKVRRVASGTYREPRLRTLCRDGISIVRNFLPEARFLAVLTEVRERIEHAERLRSVESRGDRGFGPQRPFRGGFDRWDGGTLNRFLFVDDHMPETRLAAARVAHFAGLSMGVRQPVDKVWVYQTVHGHDDENHDLQKDLHRDTFHRAAKLWLFLEDVDAEHGPFVYVNRSHHMTLARYRWEYERAMRSCNEGRAHSSFRVDEMELELLGLPRPTAIPVKANTLVIADVRGFHRRGDARPASRRLALYSGVRKNPFSPVGFSHG